MTGPRRWWRVPERGQGLVEFALVFPIFVLLIFGLFDLGRVVYDYATLSNAARAGLRLAIVNQNIAGIQALVSSSGVALGLTAGSNIDYIGYKNSGDAALGTSIPETAADCTPVAPGCIAVIKVHYQWSALTPIVGNIVPPITLSTTTEMPVERAFTNP
jgi:TadE-like protein